MKTLKVMSIIGMVLFTFLAILVGSADNIDPQISLDVGASAAIYGLAF